MGLESATYIGGLSTSNPVSSDGVSQGDDHLRLIKSVLQATFPNATKEFYFPGATAKTADFNVAVTDDNEIFPCDASSAQITVTLPLGSNLNDGFQCLIFKTDASNNVVVERNSGGSDTINGATSITLNKQYEFLWVFWTGSEWLAVTPHPESTLTTRGDLLTADAGGDETRLAIGSSGEYLRSDGNDPAWSSIQAADLPTATTSAQGAVEEATAAELRAATNGKFPDVKLIHDNVGCTAILQYQENDGASNTGMNQNSTWDTHKLNTEVSDPFNIVSLSGNRFTLGEGTYFIQAQIPIQDNGSGNSSVRFRIRNITDASTEALGITQGRSNSNARGSSLATVNAIVTITASKAFELQYFAANATNVLLGDDSMSAGSEVYAEVLITKLK